MKISEKRNTTVAAILIIMTIAVYNWFVTPHAKYLMAEEQYQQTMDSVDTKCKILTSRVNVLNKKLENLNKQYEQKKLTFFENQQAKDFLATIQTIAEKNQCTIENIRFMPVNEIAASTSDLKINKYQSSLKIFGGYTNIVKFLNSIQNRPQTVQFDSIDIEINSETGYLECSLTLSIYTLKAKERI
ncbi:MAG: type 4a pilus biogenesis protein PilO [Phycisphaerales bacterium]